MNHKPPKPTPLEKRVEALYKRMCELENIAHTELFKEATALIYEANTELMKSIRQIKELRTPWWKKLYAKKQN